MKDILKHGLKYFGVLILCLAILVGLTILFIYLSIVAVVPSLVLNLVNNFWLLIPIMLVIASTLGAWYLVTVSLKRRKLEAEREIAVELLSKTDKKLQQSSQKLQRAMEGTINAMSLTTEVRDPYTAGHQQRVAKLAVAIAQEMQLSEEQVEGIKIAGSLHDVGKIAVPAEILSKPGKLKESEFNLIKDHCETGYDMLKSIEFSWPVAAVILQHHERMDGSGYPNGLKSGEIMVESAILSVADVIESMVSHRPYRPAHNVEKALLEIIQGKGTLYHPEVVEACLKLFQEKKLSF
jgi:putative nucleotidyltransferase with HDIG domain